MNENVNRPDGKSKKTVLILVREANALNQISKYCLGLGMFTRAAVSSVDAANHIDFEMPDLLIVDEEMPAKDGNTFLEFLDSRKTEWRMPVIVLHDGPDEQSIKRPQNLFAYFVRRTPNLFSTIRMFAEELLGVSFTAVSSSDSISNSGDQ